MRAARKLEETQAQARAPAAEPQKAHRPALAWSEQPIVPPITVQEIPHVADRGGASGTVEIDLDRLGGMGYLTPRTPHSQLGSDFRVIKRQLLLNVSEAAAKNANLIMITSAVPDEGKTFVAINLAMSMAKEIDRRSSSTPTSRRRFCADLACDLRPVSRPAGRSSIRLSDILRTNIDKLTLPARRPAKHATGCSRATP